MENQIGVVNPNSLQMLPEANLQFFIFSMISGVMMGLLVSFVIIWIMKSAFHTRINAASIIASFFLSGILFVIFITIISLYSKDIWIVSSVMLWSASFMGFLWLLQPPSLEQLVARTRLEVDKLEKKHEKMKEKDVLAASKKQKKLDIKQNRLREKISVKSTNSVDKKNDL